MKKLVVINVVLLMALVALFVAYQNVSRERNELMDEKVKLMDTIDDVYEYGQLLYTQLDNGSEIKRLIPNTISVCDKNMGQCSHIDINGNLWANFWIAE